MKKIVARVALVLALVLVLESCASDLENCIDKYKSNPNYDSGIGFDWTDYAKADLADNGSCDVNQ